MKNRLQIKYYKPTTFPYTREEAIEFIKSKYPIDAIYDGKVANQLDSLPGEPIAVFYGDDIADLNVILAIGTGGKGEMGYNMPYFLIDTAKINKDLEVLNGSINDANALIEQVQSDLSQLNATIKTLQTEVTSVTNKIGNETDTANNGTVYGYINDNINKAKSELTLISKDKSLIIGAPTNEGTEIYVNIDGKTLQANNDGIISVAPEAFIQYRGENSVSISDVENGEKTISLKLNENEKILTNDVNGLLSTLSLKWVKGDSNGNKEQIQLLGKNPEEPISTIDVAEFVKDGILETVQLVIENEEKILRFTWNTDAGKQSTDISVSDMVDYYHAGRGLELVNSTFNIKVSEANDNQFFSITEGGLQVSGIKEYIADTKSEILDEVNVAKEDVYNSLITKVITDIDPLDTEAQTLFRKVVIDGKPYFYASNSSQDIMHDGEALYSVIENLRNGSGVSADVSLKISTLENKITTLETEMAKLMERIDGLSLNVDMDAIKKEVVPEAVATAVQQAKAEIISDEVFKATDGEIAVTVKDGMVTYGFSDNAIFMANYNDENVAVIKDDEI